MQKINLFCLPFAGGSKYAYRAFEEKAPLNVNMIPLDIPGRGLRMAEPSLDDLREIARDVLQQIRSRLSEPYAIYGHSMGTMIGFELVHLIIKEGLPAPLHLFFTGGGGPSAREDDDPKHLMDRPTFIKAIKELGGMPEEILANDEMLEFFVPILQTDFKAVETYAYIERPPLNIPIDVFIGEDEDISLEEAQAWEKESSLPIDLQQFPGHHFFIFEYVDQILEHIANKLSKKVII
ncbi:MAG: alpha/beta fold hydrolase [Bacteroidota bacterium]